MKLNLVTSLYLVKPENAYKALSKNHVGIILDGDCESVEEFFEEVRKLFFKK